MPDVLNYDIVLSKFKLQLHYYVHFWTNALEKGMNSFIPASYGLNSIMTIFFKNGFDIE